MVKRRTIKISLVAGTPLLILVLAVISVEVRGRPMEVEVASTPSEQQTMTILGTETERQQQDREKDQNVTSTPPPDEQQKQAGAGDDDDRSSIEQGNVNEKEDEKSDNESNSSPREQENNEPRNLDADTPVTTHNPLRCQKCCHVIKKVLLPLDESDIDHRDYVVSDREYELVLRRLISENSPPATTTTEKAPTSAATTEPPVENDHERVGRSIDKSQLPGVAPRRNYLFHPNECFICLDEFPRPHSSVNGEKTTSVEIVLFCGHKYHLECLIAWYRANRPRSKRCPVCMSFMRYPDGNLFQLPE